MGESKGENDMTEENRSFEEAQKMLTEYADSLEEIGVYIHRDLKTLPKEHVETVQDYLAAVARNIKHRNLVKDFELKYEKARGALFDCLHERDSLRTIKEDLDQLTIDVDTELEKLTVWYKKYETEHEMWDEFKSIIFTEEYDDLSLYSAKPKEGE